MANFFDKEKLSGNLVVNQRRFLTIKEMSKSRREERIIVICVHASREQSGSLVRRLPRPSVPHLGRAPLLSVNSLSERRSLAHSRELISCCSREWANSLCVCADAVIAFAITAFCFSTVSDTLNPNRVPCSLANFLTTNPELNANELPERKHFTRKCGRTVSISNSHARKWCLSNTEITPNENTHHLWLG